MSHADPDGLSEDERRTLAAVLDEIIPPSEDGRLPGAGALGLAGEIEQALAHTPDVAPAILRGLAAVDALARERGDRAFADLSGPDRLGVLGEVSTGEPAFLLGLMFHTYTGYYRDPGVVEALGLEPRPPHPQGYEMEPDDLSSLEAVRARPKLYREC